MADSDILTRFEDEAQSSINNLKTLLTAIASARYVHISITTANR